MNRKFYTVLVGLATAGLMSVPASAAINRPAAHGQGNTYEECTVECNEFADAKACHEFRQANLICTEKKKSTWPIFTAQQLSDMEC